MNNMPEVLVHCADDVGESPVWDDRHDCLRWVDLLPGIVRSVTPSGVLTAWRRGGRRTGSEAGQGARTPISVLAQRLQLMCDGRVRCATAGNPPRRAATHRLRPRLG
jgi:sugar lactone lactonase YvrE